MDQKIAIWNNLESSKTKQFGCFSFQCENLTVTGLWLHIFVNYLKYVQYISTSFKKTRPCFCKTKYASSAKNMKSSEYKGVLSTIVQYTIS